MASCDGPMNQTPAPDANPPPDRGFVRRHPQEVGLRTHWESHASSWISWARAPRHDSYWNFHRDQFLTIVPPPGARTLDLGCGEGRLARDLTARGHRVVALDGSVTLSQAAKDADPTMHVVTADGARLPFRDASFDLVVAFMSLQDMDDLEGAARDIARTLRPEGRLCLAIVHPLNSAGRFEERAAQSPFTIAGSYLDPRFYIDEVERDGLAMSFASIHRPLEQYVAAMSAAGLLVETLREPAMPEEAISSPESRRWQRVPLFLHMRGVRVDM
jgi:SAM-dependent methyltransferase